MTFGKPFLFLACCLLATPALADRALSDADKENIKTIFAWMTYCEGKVDENLIASITDLFASVGGSDVRALAVESLFGNVNPNDSVQRLEVSAEKVCSVYLAGVRRGMVAYEALNEYP
jgi:hypothetical protein